MSSPMSSSRRGGFVSGWMWLISNIASGAAVAIGLAGYLALFIPLPLNALAAFSCIGVTGLNLWGLKGRPGSMIFW